VQGSQVQAAVPAVPAQPDRAQWVNLVPEVDHPEVDHPEAARREADPRVAALWAVARPGVDHPEADRPAQAARTDPKKERRVALVRVAVRVAARLDQPPPSANNTRPYVQ